MTLALSASRCYVLQSNGTHAAYSEQQVVSAHEHMRALPEHAHPLDGSPWTAAKHTDLAPQTKPTRLDSVLSGLSANPSSRPIRLQNPTIVLQKPAGGRTWGSATAWRARSTSAGSS